MLVWQIWFFHIPSGSIAATTIDQGQWFSQEVDAEDTGDGGWSD
jgi:hypothetical protein